MATFGFIGCGNMGAALARACAKTCGGSELLLANRTTQKAQALAEELHSQAVSNDTIAKTCRYIFLGVKPQQMAALLAELSPVLAQRHGQFVLVSMAAGLPIETICTMAGQSCPVIRLMPNTPASVGAGMILYAANSSVSAAYLSEFLQAMAAAGQFDKLPESLMDAGSALSGCGPAFVCLLLEALADGGVACGLPRQKALAYAAQTVLGTAKLMQETGQHPAALKDAVCSPGGSTIAGVAALERGAFRACAIDAVRAAFEKTQELGRNK